MEQNKIPTPPNQVRKMPPPPPRPKTAPAMPAPQAEKVEPKVDENVEQKVVAKPKEKQTVSQVAPKASTKVEEPKAVKSKKMKKEGGQEEQDMDNIGLVDVRQTKKVDVKAMIYYVGIFVSLALMAVIIFLLLK